MSESEVTASRKIKAARALLSWSQADAARACGIGTATFSRLEQGGAITQRTLRDVMKVFESSGIVFIDDHIWSGVALRRKQDGSE